MSLDSPALSPRDKPDLAGFDWQDPFHLADQLTEEERMFAASARDFAQEKLQPRIRHARSFASWGRWGFSASPFPKPMAGSARGM